MGTRRRVLFVSPALTGGGAERFTSTLLAHLDRARFEPLLCLLRPEATYPLAADVPVSVLHQYGAHTVPRTIWRLRGLLRRLRPDTVVSTLSYTSLFVGEALGRRPSATRWVARFAAPPELIVTDWQTWLFDRWLRRVFPRAALHVANSNGLADEVARAYPTAAGKVRVVYNPTDFDLLDVMGAEAPAGPADDGAPVLISVGRLTEQKRPDVLLEAFARLRRRLPARLWICGDGSLRPRVAAEVARLGLGDSVRLLGFCANPYALMRRASAYVLTSDYEGLPNALIEAQGLGLPAVSTRCPNGPEEIIDDGRTGFLVDRGDAGAVAGAVETILRDPGLRAGMGAAARERARRRFDARAIVPQWEALLG